MGERANKTKAYLFVFSVIALVVAGCRPVPTPAQVKQGAELVPVICTRCHPLTTVKKHHDDVAGWYKVTDRMKGHGAQFTAEEQTSIVGYLAKTQPK